MTIDDYRINGSVACVRCYLCGQWDPIEDEIRVDGKRTAWILECWYDGVRGHVVVATESQETIEELAVVAERHEWDDLRTRYAMSPIKA